MDAAAAPRPLVGVGRALHEAFHLRVQGFLEDLRAHIRPADDCARTAGRQMTATLSAALLLPMGLALAL